MKQRLYKGCNLGWDLPVVMNFVLVSSTAEQAVFPSKLRLVYQALSFLATPCAVLLTSSMLVFSCCSLQFLWLPVLFSEQRHVKGQSSKHLSWAFQNQRGWETDSMERKKQGDRKKLWQIPWECSVTKTLVRSCLTLLDPVCCLIGTVGAYTHTHTVTSYMFLQQLGLLGNIHFPQL